MKKTNIIILKTISLISWAISAFFLIYGACLIFNIGGIRELYIEMMTTIGVIKAGADAQFEILLGNKEDIEIHIESLVGTEMKVEKVSLEGLPERKNYTLRLQVEAMFFDEKTCKISFRDVGFGEFFPATDFYVEKVIHLGRSNGQYNSLS